jgi:hypothetical protein
MVDDAGGRREGREEEKMSEDVVYKAWNEKPGEAYGLF